VEDYHPELANYEPHEPRPIRSRARQNLLRGVVLLAITALVLPGIITTWTFASSAATASCNVWAQYQVPEQHRTEVRFEVMGPGVLGWECYVTTATGERHLTSLGLLPGLNDDQIAVLRSGTV
jgi:hypothetical protein